MLALITRFIVPRALGFERTAPAHNDEVAIVLSREVDDSQASFPLSERETHADAVRCASNGTQPIAKLLRPRWPFMLGLVDVARGHERPRLRWPVRTGRCDWDEWAKGFE